LGSRFGRRLLTLGDLSWLLGCVALLLLFG
jgi:hypothetical protein